MNRPVIYVAGPIAGIHDRNRPAFSQATVDLLRLGWTVINPASLGEPEHDGPCPIGTGMANPGAAHRHACYMRRDLAHLLTANAIYLLPGWDVSVGARCEQHVAAVCGLRVITAPLYGQPPPSAAPHHATQEAGRG